MTKFGEDIQVGNKVTLEDGQKVTIRKIVSGIYRGSRLIEWGHGGQWGHIWNNSLYDVE